LLILELLFAWDTMMLNRSIHNWHAI